MNRDSNNFYKYTGVDIVKTFSGFEDVVLLHTIYNGDDVCLYFNGKNLTYCVTFKLASKTIIIHDFICRFDTSIVLLTIMHAQIIYGRKLGIRIMLAFAKGNFTRVDICSLYYLCAVVGFLPTIESSSVRYLMRTLEIEDTVEEFFNSDSGLNALRMLGSEWFGYLDLAKGSYGVEKLKKELAFRKILHSLE